MSDSEKPAESAQPVPPSDPQPKPRPRPKSKAKAKGYRPPAGDETPVIGGRFLVAAGIIGALVILPMSPIGAQLEPREPPKSDTSSWKTGSTSTVRITLVTADYATLACAADKAFEGKHCVNKSEKELWPRDPNAPLDDNKADIIQPYRTWNDNRLILVAGLWAQPALATRLHIEPPGNLLPEKLARFVTECEMRFVGEMEKPKLKWGSGSSWGADPNTPQVQVAIAESCKLIPEPSEACPGGVICALLTRL
jgi:hypothetical protein